MLRVKKICFTHIGFRKYQVWNGRCGWTTSGWEFWAWKVCILSCHTVSRNYSRVQRLQTQFFQHFALQTSLLLIQFWTEIFGEKIIFLKVFSLSKYMYRNKFHFFFYFSLLYQNASLTQRLLADSLSYSVFFSVKEFKINFPNSFFSQTLINLMLTGYSVSNVWDSSRTLSGLGKL